MSIKEKVEDFVKNAVNYTDAEYRKALAEVVHLFHDTISDDKIGEIAPIAEVPQEVVHEEPEHTPDAVDGQ